MLVVVNFFRKFISIYFFERNVVDPFVSLQIISSFFALAIMRLSFDPGRICTV